MNEGLINCIIQNMFDNIAKRTQHKYQPFLDKYQLWFACGTVWRKLPCKWALSLLWMWKKDLDEQNGSHNNNNLFL